MTAPAWMPLYIADYLADTGHLSAVEHGAYMLLIMHYWQHGGLPLEDGKLARIARLTAKEWASVRGTLADLFLPDWRHKRVEEELANASEALNKRSAAGKAGASARYGNRTTNGRQPNSIAGAGLPSPSPEDRSSSVGNTPPREAGDLRFEAELRAALGGRAPPEDVDFGPILALVAAGYDPVKDILAACRAAAGKAAESVGSWQYYVTAVSRKSKANGTPSEPVAWLPAESPLWAAMSERYQHAKGPALRAVASNFQSGLGAYIPKAWLDMASHPPREAETERAA